MEILYPDIVVQLSGQDGNVFSIVGRVQRALKDAGHSDAAREFSRATRCAQSYEEVLQLVMRTVGVI